MGSIRVTMSVSLDGVARGFGRLDEDTRGDFRHGGWGQRYTGDVMGREMAKGMAAAGDMLFGRHSWEELRHGMGAVHRRQPVHRPQECGHQVRRVEDSRGRECLAELDPERGDAVESVTGLKSRSDREVSITGSASLVRSLHAAGLIDRYALLIQPLTLGHGARLFDDPAP
ncbi:MAG TPA: dihydrofolate reductase family protein [Jiangellaceae bacterium]|nr:dihydrofolate reductase family protein [Jiangellaceae bacterium]